MNKNIFTIGHSTHRIDFFIVLLKNHNINVVADVRSTAYSNYNPQYNKNELRQSLKDNKIKYVFMGKEFGARSEDEYCYENDKVQYDIIAETDLFRQGIERIKQGIKKYNIALMCSEKEPLDCHRSILVSRYIEEEGYEVKHILANSKLKTQRDLENELLKGQNGLFYNEEIKNAYKKQENKIAYRRNIMVEEF